MAWFKRYLVCNLDRHYRGELSERRSMYGTMLLDRHQVPFSFLSSCDLPLANEIGLGFGGNEIVLPFQRF